MSDVQEAILGHIRSVAAGSDVSIAIVVSVGVPAVFVIDVMVSSKVFLV